MSMSLASTFELTDRTVNRPGWLRQRLRRSRPADCGWSEQNRAFINQILKSQLTGKTALPYGLGMEHAAYRDVIKMLAEGRLRSLDSRWQGDEWPSIKAKADLLASLYLSRLDERNQLVDLMMKHADEKAYGAEVMAVIISTACLSSNHLWRALGLQHRDQLRALLLHNYPSLATANTQDMRWKKFFYRQLCESGGDYVCRAPSCQECATFAECFGPED
ncbi:nitrogen fixation protein NifQ [Corallincola platygyrae]|uniref:Nitrogen fixation protein NifQ n=1 Tax=Corallincola platygyrae TaxID=1193278 RepID=A0ABW4XG85_9GAMM